MRSFICAEFPLQSIILFKNMRRAKYKSKGHVIPVNITSNLCWSLKDEENDDL